MCAVAAGVAGAGTQPRLYTLKTGDRFDVRGTRISCTVGVASPGRAPTVTCGPTRAGSRTPLAKSYAFAFGDRGVHVIGPGSLRHVVYHAATDKGAPLGDPAPHGGSAARQTVHLRPVVQGLEGVTIAGSSVVCLAVSYPKPQGPSLNCTLSSAAITKALARKRLSFRPLTVTLSTRALRVWRMSKTKTQRVIYSRAEPAR